MERVGVIAVSGVRGTSDSVSWPARFAIAALVLSNFSGHFSQIVPVPLDRIAIVLTFCAWIWSVRNSAEPLRVGWVHVVLVLQAAWAAVSGLAFGGFSNSAAVYAYLDQLLIPSALFIAAPVLFARVRDRDALLTWLMLVAIYLGISGTLQSLGVQGLLFPRYLAESSVPGEITRASGPSLQPAANGAALAMLSGAALFSVEKSTGVNRILAAVAFGSTAIGTIFSLTRSVWIGWLLAVVLYVTLSAKMRIYARRFVPLAVAAALTVLIASPGLLATLSERASTVRSLDDRGLTNVAAIAMANKYPVTGVGWGNFLKFVDAYVSQPDLEALTTTHILAHNVILSRAAELGFVGAVLLVLSLVLGPVRYGGRSLLASRSADAYGRVLACATIAWMTVAMLTPMGYTFPNYFLWILSGIASAGTVRGADGLLRSASNSGAAVEA